MRTIDVGVISLNPGSIGGIVLFDHGPGMDFQPIFLAIACALAAAVAGARVRRDP